MSSFLGRIRSGVGKAAFEADKLRRINTVQSEIKALQDEVQRALNRVGDVAYELYRAGEVDHPALQDVCLQVQRLYEQIQAYEVELESIRQEEYVEESLSAQNGRICPQGHGPIPPENNFCQECGARAVEVRAPARVNERFCQNCGQQLGAQSRFCAHCGTLAPDPVAEPVPAFCHECGAKLLSDAVFCSECGATVNPGEQAARTIHEIGGEVEHELSTASQQASSHQSTEMKAVDNSEEVISAEQPEHVWEAEAAEETPAAESQVDGDLCPGCGTPRLPDALFCAECGYRFA